MNDSLFGLLLYVFENYPQLDHTNESKREEITEEMINSGFNKNDVEQIMDWFLDLNQQRQLLLNSTLNQDMTSHRVFSQRECECMTPEARSRILELQQKGYIDTVTRELVLDRLIALDEPSLDSPEIDWLVLVVMYQDSDQPHQRRLIEDMVMLEESSICH